MKGALIMLAALAPWECGPTTCEVTVNLFDDYTVPECEADRETCTPDMLLAWDWCLEKPTEDMQRACLDGLYCKDNG